MYQLENHGYNVALFTSGNSNGLAKGYDVIHQSLMISLPFSSDFLGVVQEYICIHVTVFEDGSSQNLHGSDFSRSSLLCVLDPTLLEMFVTAKSTDFSPIEIKDCNQQRKDVKLIRVAKI